MSRLGSNIRKLRNKKEVSQTTLGKYLGVGKTTVSNYETGYSTPDNETLAKLSSFFQVTVDYLLGITDDPHKESSEDTYTVPEEFTDSEAAREYVNKHQIFGFGGFDSNKLDDEEIIKFANELLEQMKMVSWKYRK